jgi:hypothetical protein
MKLSKFSAIFNSDEIKVFLSNIGDITKAYSSFSNQNYEELYLKYKNAFPDYYEVCI